MKKIVASLFALGAISYGFTFAQSCTGTIRAGIKDDGGTSISATVTVKDVAYYEAPTSDVHHIFTEDKMANTHFEGFTVSHPVTLADPSASVKATAAGVTFPALCNTYSVQMTLSYEGKDMKVGFYNIPSGKDVDINSITFAEGYYYVDMEGGSKLISTSSGKYILNTTPMSFGHNKNISGK